LKNQAPGPLFGRALELLEPFMSIVQVRRMRSVTAGVTEGKP